MTRRPNASDRFVNVRGYSEAFLDEICALIDDIHNPGWLFCIAPNNNHADFCEQLERVRPDLDHKNWLASKEAVERNGATIPFSLASEECAYHLVDLINCKFKPQTKEGEPYRGKIKAVLLFHQHDYLRYVPHVLQKCESVKIYHVIDNLPNGEMEVGEWEGGVPATVDVTAAQNDDPELHAIPVTAMYGKCFEIAQQTLCPQGYAYVSAVTVASVFVKPNSNVHPNLFTAPTGGVHTGKSLAGDRAMVLFGLQDEMGAPIDERLKKTTLASDRGVYRALENKEKECVSRLIANDEGRGTLSKGNIQGSSLIPLLCELWSATHAGVADKFGNLELRVQLSLLLNLKVSGPHEFPEIFTHATAHGFYDRIIFGVRADEQWSYKPWDFVPERDVFKPTPTRPDIKREIFDAAHEWSAAGEDRDRLAENALRVAYVSSAINQDELVSRKALDAALCLMEWQEQIRKVFQPAKGANEAEECMKTVLDAFRNAPGRWLNWRKVARKHHWYEKYPRSLLATKRLLEKEKVIALDKTTNRHFLTEEPK